MKNFNKILVGESYKIEDILCDTPIKNVLIHSVY